MVENTAHLELLQRITNLIPPLFAMGGFAEDALLHRALTRPRADLDLLVERAGIDVCQRLLESCDVRVEPRHTDASGRPLCLATARDEEPSVEVWICDALEDGCYSLELPGELPGKSSQSGRFRLLLPPDTFRMRPSDLDGISIHSVSPRALYLLRETSARTRSKADGGVGDREVCRALKQAYLRGYSGEQLTPQLVGV